jgi:hypothetical protein
MRQSPDPHNDADANDDKHLSFIEGAAITAVSTSTRNSRVDSLMAAATLKSSISHRGFGGGGSTRRVSYEDENVQESRVGIANTTADAKSQPKGGLFQRAWLTVKRLIGEEGVAQNRSREVRQNSGSRSFVDSELLLEREIEQQWDLAGSDAVGGARGRVGAPRGERSAASATSGGSDMDSNNHTLSGWDFNILTEEEEVLPPSGVATADRSSIIATQRAIAPGSSNAASMMGGSLEPAIAPLSFGEFARECATSPEQQKILLEQERRLLEQKHQQQVDQELEKDSSHGCSYSSSGPSEHSSSGGKADTISAESIGLLHSAHEQRQQWSSGSFPQNRSVRAANKETGGRGSRPGLHQTQQHHSLSVDAALISSGCYKKNHLLDPRLEGSASSSSVLVPERHSWNGGVSSSGGGFDIGEQRRPVAFDQHINQPPLWRDSAGQTARPNETEIEEGAADAVSYSHSQRLTSVARDQRDQSTYLLGGAAFDDSEAGLHLRLGRLLMWCCW